MNYKQGDWYVYCDICGQRHLASKTTQLSNYTGRGGLVVCRHDTDKIDPGLQPFNPRKEHNIPWARVGHVDTTDGSPMVDTESMSYQYFLAASQDVAILMASQDDAWLIASVPI